MATIDLPAHNVTPTDTVDYTVVGDAATCLTAVDGDQIEMTSASTGFRLASGGLTPGLVGFGLLPDSIPLASVTAVELVTYGWRDGGGPQTLPFNPEYGNTVDTQPWLHCTAESVTPLNIALPASPGWAPAYPVSTEVIDPEWLQSYPGNGLCPAWFVDFVDSAYADVLCHVDYTALRVTYSGAPPHCRLYPREDRYGPSPRMYPLPASRQTPGRLTGYL
ncbi:MAG TPA: hypothetical protein VN088_14795 [Nocardioides sp.]|nr:hypothetical protein [Nocardioides sp.]